MNALLAKSPKTNQPPVTLARHSQDVAHCAELLFGLPEHATDLGYAWCRFFQINEPTRFLFNLRLACLFHDLGKATPGFQLALHHNHQQLFRHEHLSVFLLLVPEIRTWISRHPQTEFPALLAAVGGHHLKAGEPSPYGNPSVLFGQPLMHWNGKPSIQIPLSHPDVAAILAQIAQVLEIAQPSNLQERLFWSKQDISHFNLEFQKLAFQSKKANSDDPKLLSQEHRLMMALKAALIVCDALGSAMPRLSQGQQPMDWVRQFVTECFSPNFLTLDWVEENILIPRARDIENRRNQPFNPYKFQLEAAKQPERTLLPSGCGSGKTLAAWYWVQAQLIQFRARRIIFLYPTRATATEGFRDYVSLAGELAGLIHGTALFDLECMLTNPDEDGCSGKAYQKPDERLFALGYWPKQVISATVDTFLSFMANQYSAICLLPLLVDSILVVDEVHAFDSAMFKALQEFLKHFDIPVLCMTASLAQERRNTLEHIVKLHGFPKHASAFPELARQMNYPRYEIAWSQKEELIQRVIGVYESGQRVLWVVNQVDRCQRLAQDLQAILSPKAILCYHSRFRLMDRSQIHNRVIQKFQAPRTGKGLILVTTQVCEMSLDLDADVLVSDLAPVTALIQRMGRCCRRSEPWANQDYGKVWVTEPVKSKPYEAHELDEARQFIDYLVSRDTRVSQQDLNAYLEQLDSGIKGMPDYWTAFVRGGLYSPSSQEVPFRDTNDFTVDAVLSGDLDAYLQMCKDKDLRCDGYLVPVPRYMATFNDRLKREVMEAPSENYCAVFGFQSKEVANA